MRNEPNSPKPTANRQPPTAIIRNEPNSPHHPRPPGPTNHHHIERAPKAGLLYLTGVYPDSSRVFHPGIPPQHKKTKRTQLTPLRVIPSDGLRSEAQRPKAEGPAKTRSPKAIPIKQTLFAAKKRNEPNSPKPTANRQQPNATTRNEPNSRTPSVPPPPVSPKRTQFHPAPCPKSAKQTQSTPRRTCRGPKTRNEPNSH